MKKRTQNIAFRPSGRSIASNHNPKRLSSATRQSFFELLCTMLNVIVNAESCFSENLLLSQMKDGSPRYQTEMKSTVRLQTLPAASEGDAKKKQQLRSFACRFSIFPPFQYSSFFICLHVICILFLVAATERIKHSGSGRDLGLPRTLPSLLVMFQSCGG